jgi:hypothetical protein
MNTGRLITSCAVAVLFSGTAAIAQQTMPSQPADRAGSRTQTPTTAPANHGADASHTMIVGCVQTRSAYVQSQGSAAGRVANNVGGGNDFVLIQMAPAVAATAPVEPGGSVGVSVNMPGTGTAQASAPGASANASVGTSGTMSTYSLSGHAAELRNHVGKRVEIVGTVARANASANASPNAKTSTGADLQTMTVTSVREVPGSCASR